MPASSNKSQAKRKAVGWANFGRRTLRLELLSLDSRGITFG
jgi:hypothetical protein